MKDEYLDDQVFNKYGDVNNDRLLGLRGEKESSIAATRRLAHLGEQNKFSLVEVGCSAGHLVRSLSERIGPQIDYQGFDIDEHAVALGNETLQSAKLLESSELAVASIFDLPVDNKSVDASVCLNVLEHLHHPGEAIESLLRITRDFCLIRTLVGDTTWIIQEAKNNSHVGFNEKDTALPAPNDEIDMMGIPRYRVYHNVWGQNYLEHLIKKIAPTADVSFEVDNDFDADRLNADTATSGLHLATQVVAGRQVEGFFMPPHTWIKVSL